MLVPFIRVGSWSGTSMGGVLPVVLATRQAESRSPLYFPVLAFAVLVPISWSEIWDFVLPVDGSMSLVDTLNRCSGRPAASAGGFGV